MGEFAKFQKMTMVTRECFLFWKSLTEQRTLRYPGGRRGVRKCSSSARIGSFGPFWKARGLVSKLLKRDSKWMLQFQATFHPLS